VVLLSGEPGIGKSRVLNALRQRLEAQGVQALRFQCSPYYVNSAFWPIIDNFDRALKFSRDETADVKLDKLEALVVTHLEHACKVLDLHDTETHRHAADLLNQDPKLMPGSWPQLAHGYSARSGGAAER
jgi:predicted ATPase